VYNKQVSLFPNEDILTKEIESWKGFADNIRSEKDRQLFNKMLNDCYKYATAINAKGEPFPTEPLITSCCYLRSPAGQIVAFLYRTFLHV